jgi:hypothetical protein
VGRDVARSGTLASRLSAGPELAAGCSLDDRLRPLWQGKTGIADRDPAMLPILLKTFRPPLLSRR